MTQQMNRLIVKFNLLPEDMPGVLDRLVEEIISDIPGEAVLVRRPSKSGRVILAVDPSVDVVQLATDLSRNARVAYAEPDITDSGMQGESNMPHQHPSNSSDTG